MSKRLQVLIDPKEYKEFAKIASSNGVSLGAWVRQSLRKVVRMTPVRDSSDRIRKLRLLASQSNAPSGDIETILSEIEKGRDLKEP